MAPQTPIPVQEPTQPVEQGLLRPFLDAPSQRRRLRTLLAPLGLAVMVSGIACGGDSDTATGPSSVAPGGAAPPPAAVQCPAPFTAGSITATVDNSSWQAACTYAILSSSSVGTVVSVSGTDLGNPQKIVTFAFLGATAGTYAINNAVVSNGGASFVSTSGTVTVTTLSSARVAGTFSFTGSGPAGAGTVRNGSFNVAF